MLRTLSKSVCAGVLIGIGGSVYLACDNKYVGAVLFSVALLCICYLEYYLYTGKIGYLAYECTPRSILSLATGLAGNLVTAAALGLTVRLAIPALGERAVAAVDGKLEQSPAQALVRAMLCGVLMYLAVRIFREKNTPIGIVFCIPVFILSGFEHSIADMFYIGAAGMCDGRAPVFMFAVILGNSLGSLILPLLERIGGKNET